MSELLLSDGGPLLLSDPPGGSLTMDSILLLSDGTPLRLSDGGYLFLSTADANITPAVGTGHGSGSVEDSRLLAVGSGHGSGSVTVSTTGSVSITPAVGRGRGFALAPATRGRIALNTRQLVPDPGFFTIWLVEIDWTNTETYVLYATIDVDIDGVPYDGRVGLDSIKIDRRQVNTGFGTIRLSDFTVSLSNGDGGLDVLFGGVEPEAIPLDVYGRPDPRNFKVRVKLYDPAAQPTPYLSEEFFGRIAQVIRMEDEIQLLFRDIDVGIFDKTIPGGQNTIDAERWPKAPDLGSLIPLPFGQVAKMPLRYAVDDTLEQIYQYVVGYGDLEIIQLYRRRTDGFFEIVGPFLTPQLGFVDPLEWPLMQHLAGATTMIRDPDFSIYGNDRAILVLIMLSDTQAPVSQVLYGPGNRRKPELDPDTPTFTNVGSLTANGVRLEAWVLIAPPEGTGILQVEFDAGGTSFPGVVGIGLNDVSQEIGDYSLVVQSGTGQTATVDVVSEAGEQIIAFMMANRGQSVTGTGSHHHTGFQFSTVTTRTVATQTPGPTQVELVTGYVDPQADFLDGTLVTSPNSVTWQPGGVAAVPTWNFFIQRNAIMTVQQFAQIYGNYGFTVENINGVDVLVGTAFPPDILRQPKSMDWVAGAVVIQGPPSFARTVENGLTLIQMRRRQEDPNGSLLPLFGDVVEAVTQRNHALAIREIILNDLWGINTGAVPETVDEDAFTAAAAVLAALPAFCDGAIVDQAMRVQDVFEQMAFVRGLHIDRNSLGWTIFADTPPAVGEEAAMSISIGAGQSKDDQPVLSHTGLRSRDVSSRVSRVILRYRRDFTGKATEGFFRKITRDVFGDPGQEHSGGALDNLFISDDLTADMLLSYIASRDLFEDQSLAMVLSAHGRFLREKNLINVNVPKLGLVDQLMRIGDNGLDADEKSLLLLLFDVSEFTYVPSIPFPPADPTLGDLLDYSQILPDPATSLGVVRTLSIINVTQNETITVVLEFTTPIVNFAKAIVRYQQEADLRWAEIPPITQSGTVRAVISGLIPLAVYNFTVQIVNPYGLVSMGDPYVLGYQLPSKVPLKPVIHGRVVH